MDFCPNCRNYISIKFKKENDKYKITHNCKCCKYKADKTEDIKENSCMYYNPNEIDKLQYYIKYKENMKYDPTIPHTDIVPCPNESCESKNKDIRNDVMYANIDNTKLKILYVCNYCQTHWSNST